MITLRSMVIFLLSLLMGASCLTQQGNFPPGSGSGVTSVSSLPGTCSPSSIYYVTGTGTLFLCQPGGTTFAQIALGAQTSAPPMAVYFSNQCPVTNATQCYYTTANGIYNNTANWTNTTTALNCTTCAFTSAVTGMSIMGAASFGDDGQGNSGGQIATTTNVTITYVSATQVTLSAIPLNACAANCSVFFGNLDDANAVTIDAAIAALPYCTRMELASSNYFYSSPHHYTNPPACAAIGPGLGAYGTITLSGGFSIIGRGRGATAIVLNTNFPNGDTCAHKSATGQAVGGCFPVALMGDWANFRIDGGNQTTTTLLNGKALITMSVGEIDNFDCLNMGWQNASSMVGINMSVLGRLYNVDNSGCGTIGVQNETGSASEGINKAWNLVVENSSTDAILIAGAATDGDTNLECYGCTIAMPNGLTSGTGISNAGGIVKFFGGNVQPAAIFSSSNTGITGYRCTGASGQAYFDGTYFEFTTSVGATGGNALWADANNCSITLANSQITATAGTTNAFTDFGTTSGTRLQSLGGNTFSGGTNVANGMSVNFAPTDTLSGLTGTYRPTCATTGLAQTACTVTIGTNEGGTMHVTAGGVGGAFTMTLTFFGSFGSSAGNPASCQFFYANTGTGTWTAPAILTLSSKSLTAQTIAGTGTTVNASTYDMNYNCRLVN
jgi:hypothetical protein